MAPNITQEAPHTTLQPCETMSWPVSERDFCNLTQKRPKISLSGWPGLLPIFLFAEEHL